MPELPEVETLRRSLLPRLPGLRIEGVEVGDPRLREPVDVETLRRRLPGRRIQDLRRRAKYLLIDLEEGATLVIHLGMSGRLTLVPGTLPKEPHEHLSLRLSSGERLRFRDPRRFGLVVVLPTEGLGGDRRFAHLGNEPVGEAALTGARLRRLAAGRRGPVKSFLMNASVVVGIGNIYASEALHRAGIHPARSVARIGAERWERLAGAVREVLEEAIAEGGTTLNDFTDGDGRDGYFQVSLAVYGREGEGCPRCGAPVRRVMQSGRSTFYCPRCQR